MTLVTTDEPPVEEDEKDARQPRARGSERAVLGCALVTAESSAEAVHALVDDLASIVEPRDMWWPAHERIWAALITATAEAAPCDRAAVASRVRRDGGPNAEDVIRMLIDLPDAGCPMASAPWHAGKVVEAAVARRTAATALQLYQKALTPGFDQAVDIPASLLELETATGVRSGGGPVDLLATFERAVDLIENPERIDVIPSGLIDLDMLYPGARPGQLIIIGARPGVGKSTLGLTWAAEAAVRLRYPAMIFSLEMTAVEVMHRLISARARVDLGRILTGQCDEADWARIGKEMPAIAEAPLIIDDTANLTIADIRTRVRRAARKGLRLVVVDYLQLLTLGKSESRQIGVDEIVRQLKVLAGEAGLAILVLSQLNRAAELRHDKKPAMADLRESGGLENHADLVLLIHRPDMYAKDDRPGEVDLIVPKNRNGRTGTAPCAWQGHFARIVSMSNWMV